MGLRFTGQSHWTRANGATYKGEAVAVWHRPGDGRLTIDLTDGQYHYGVVIEGTSDEGTWTCPDDGDAGAVFAKLCLTRHGILLNGMRHGEGMELNGTWDEGGEVYEWRIVFNTATDVPEEDTGGPS
jgi:hypothetical protein